MLYNKGNDVKDLEIKNSEEIKSVKSSLVRIIYEGKEKNIEAVFLNEQGNKTSLILFRDLDVKN